MQAQVKSRIPLKVDKHLQNKENVPSGASKGETKKAAIKPPTGRKTLVKRKEISKGKKTANSQRTGSQTKNAPDFEKLHKKWEAKLAKGKAVTKRSNTKIEPFNLTKEAYKNAKSDDEFYEEFEEFEIDETDNARAFSPNRNVEPECQVKNCRFDQSKAPQPTTPLASNEFKVPTSIHKTNSNSSVKRKSKRVAGEGDLFEFKPDNSALKSILNNKGIQRTPKKGIFRFGCSPSPLPPKRSSIYNIRRNRPPSAFEKRLSMRRAAAAMAKMRLAERRFEPLNTLIGVQDFGNRFTDTPLKELPSYCNSPRETIPEESGEGEALSNDGVPCAISTERSSPYQISWAETLKLYSMSKQEDCSPVKDQEALIAQLEEEVRQTLNNVKEDRSNDNPREQLSFLCASSCKKNDEIIQNSNADSSLLLQRPVKTSIYRKLFESPSYHGYDKEAPWDKPSYSEEYSTSLSFGSKTERFCHESNGEIKQDDLAESTTLFMPVSTQRFTSPNERSLHVLSEGKGRPYQSERSTFASATTTGFSQFRHFGYKQRREVLSASKSAVSNLEVPRGFATPNFSTGLERRTDTDVFVPESCINETANSSNASLGTRDDDALTFIRRTDAYHSLSAFRRIPTPRTNTTERSFDLNGNVSTPNMEQKFVIPTPRRGEVAIHPNYDQEGMVGFRSRHRQVMREALIKSRDQAQEILLDAEVSFFARNVNYMRKYNFALRLVNPLVKLFSEGDEMHFVPVLAQ